MCPLLYLLYVCSKLLVLAEVCHVDHSVVLGLYLSVLYMLSMQIQHQKIPIDKEFVSNVDHGYNVIK